MGCWLPVIWLLLHFLLVAPTDARPLDDNNSSTLQQQQPELVGGSSSSSSSSYSSSSRNNLGSLLSDMYSSILRTRLEQLLEGVTVAGEQASSEQVAGGGVSGGVEEQEQLAGGQPSDRTVTIHLPQPVTEIPRHIFTSLPGRSLYVEPNNLNHWYIHSSFIW